MPGFMQDYKNPPKWMNGYNGKTRTVSAYNRIKARASARVNSKRTINKTITKRAEKKHFHIIHGYNSNFDQTGQMVSLTDILQGTDNHTRIGAYIRPTSLKFTFSIHPPVSDIALTLCRVIIFQFHESDGPGPPEVGDLLETVSVALARLYSPYLQDSNNTKVLYDKLFYVMGSVNSQQKPFIGRVLVSKIKQIRYLRGGGAQVDGSDKLFMYITSEVTDATASNEKPFFDGVSNVRYTDL